MILIQPQDTTATNGPIVTRDSVPLLNIPNDTIKTTIDLSGTIPVVQSPLADSVFIRFEAREKKFREAQIRKQQVVIKKEVKEKDTTDYQALANKTFPIVNIGEYTSFGIPVNEDMVLKPKPVFVEHQHKTDFTQVGVRTKPTFIFRDTFLFFFLILVLLLIWIKSFYKKYLQDIIESVFNQQLSIKILRDKNIIHKRVFTTLNIMYIVVLSTFIYQCSVVFSVSFLEDQGIFEFLKILSIVTIIILSKYLINHIVGIVFKVKNQVTEFLHSSFIITKNLGLSLIPITFMLFYASQYMQMVFVVISAIIIAFFYFLRVLRGIQIILRKDVLIFYSLLYLCTLEILPVLVGFKIIKELV